MKLARAVISAITCRDSMNKIGYYKDLLLVLTKKEIKLRYKNSYFGYLWSIVNPLAFAAVFYFVFGTIWRAPTENYPLFLVAGLFPWHWFSNSMIAATTVYVANVRIIKKINFPRSMLPFAITLQDLFHFLCAIPVVFIFLLVYGKAPALAWIVGIPVLLAIQLAFVYGLSLCLASVSLFFRDLQQITSILVMFLFYPTPILYPVTMIPAQFRDFLFLNPVAPIIVCWRRLFLEGTLDVRYVVAALAYAGAAVAVGSVVYRRLKWRFAEVL
jgi:lipopolysaccharide transport system permease protein